MAKKSDVVTENKNGYTAYADFTLGRKEYKAGDHVTLPEDYELDAVAVDFRNVERKGKTPRGLVFRRVDGYDKETKQPLYKSAILPIE